MSKEDELYEKYKKEINIITDKWKEDTNTYINKFFNKFIFICLGTVLIGLILIFISKYL